MIFSLYQWNNVVCTFFFVSISLQMRILKTTLEACKKNLSTTTGSSSEGRRRRWTRKANAWNGLIDGWHLLFNGSFFFVEKKKFDSFFLLFVFFFISLSSTSSFVVLSTRETSWDLKLSWWICGILLSSLCKYENVRAKYLLNCSRRNIYLLQKRIRWRSNNKSNWKAYRKRPRGGEEKGQRKGEREKLKQQHHH